MKATVDRNGCIGCGLCAEICPDVFDIAEAVKEPTRSNIHKAHEAAESCPVQVIDVQD